MIFARKITPPLTSLVKRIDQATLRFKGCRMGSFVVFLSEEPDLKGKLKELAAKEDLQKIVLTIDRPAGPEDYDIARDSDVTVVLYVDRVVKVSRAYKAGQFTEQAIPAIIRDLGKILPRE